MEFRKAAEEDIESIMTIIKQAQEYLKNCGVNQWQDNYPNAEIIKEDIDNKIGYVLVKYKTISATAAVSFDGESTYASIYDGKWLSSGEYAVIHRIAVHSDYKGLGLASMIISNVEKMCLERDIHSIRIDTHRENRSMRRLLEKNGFKYCGIIYLEDGNERIAFEKLF